MRSDWREVTLGEFVRLQRGHDLTASEQQPGRFPVMGSAGPNGTHSEFKARGPGVVIGRSGASMGRVHYCATDYWPHNTCMYVTDFLGNNPLFVSYKLAQLDLARYNSGSAQPSLNRNYIYGMSLRIPSRRAQDQIVDVVHSIDEKICVNRRINQTLEAMAQAIFKSWFVDFDPVKAKIVATQEGRDPQRAAMSAISGKSDTQLEALPPEHYEQLVATALLFPDEMDASELGEIPKGWDPATLLKLCELNSSSWSAKTLPSSVRYVDLANTKNGEIVEVQTMTGSDIPSRARRILETGDTIVGTVRPGNRSFAFVGEAGLTGSTGFAVVRPKADYLREYVYLAATSDANIERLAHLADGGAYPAVRPELVVSETLPIPPRDLIREFHRISSNMFDQMLATRRAKRDLADLRDTLLPKLLSGELSVEALVDSTWPHNGH
jgi:type I restriction enzyme, S subunit